MPDSVPNACFLLTPQTCMYLTCT